MFCCCNRGIRQVTIVNVLLALWSAGPFAAAQDQPSPNWEIFGGYSLLLSQQSGFFRR